MEFTFTEGEVFKNRSFKEFTLSKGEYEGCTFVNCDFSSLDISDFIFTACEFQRCNLSMVKMINTAFRGVQFMGCKMLGLHFNDCNDFGLKVSFDECTLNHSSFFQVKLNGAIFKDCQIQEADCSESDFTKCMFENCDFSRTVFYRANIQKADFSTASNFSIDPELNRIKGAKFSLHGVAGLLDKYDIEIEGF